MVRELDRLHDGVRAGEGLAEGHDVAREGLDLAHAAVPGIRMLRVAGGDGDLDPALLERRDTTSRPMNPVPPATTTRISPPSAGARGGARSFCPILVSSCARRSSSRTTATSSSWCPSTSARTAGTVESVADGKRALERVRRGAYQLMILDIQLPGMDGLAVCAELRRDRPAPPYPW
jgi:hypothetical protein